MVVQVAPETEATIDKLVANGTYASASDVVDEAVRLLEERERKLGWLRAELAIGEEQEKRGELIDFTPELLDRLSLEAEENARSGKPIKDAVKP